jgi:hypothetical protein
MTRLWPDGQPLEGVETASTGGGEPPLRFTWQGQEHRVTEVTQSWRVDLDWWRERIWRAYFRLGTNTGLLVVIYQDLLSGKWYLQRLYD